MFAEVSAEGASAVIVLGVVCMGDDALAVGVSSGSESNPDVRGSSRLLIPLSSGSRKDILEPDSAQDPF